VHRLPEAGEVEVANKGGVRAEGTAGCLLAMARETGGGPVRRGRGTEDAGAQPACPREEDEGGARTSAREERGRPGGPAGWWVGMGERGGGPRLGQKPEMGQSFKRNSFRISIDFRNLAEVWKIAQGDLGRNLTWGFFLTSSRLSKYFRKMKYVMP
jgi:hypothetical protein